MSVGSSPTTASARSFKARSGKDFKIPYTSSSTDTWNVLEAAAEDPLDAGRGLSFGQHQFGSRLDTGRFQAGKIDTAGHLPPLGFPPVPHHAVIALQITDPQAHH